MGDRILEALVPVGWVSGVLVVLICGAGAIGCLYDYIAALKAERKGSK